MENLRPLTLVLQELTGKEIGVKNDDYVYLDNKTVVSDELIQQANEKQLECLKTYKLNEIKQTRDIKVNEIKITLSTSEYLDGNELAQTRMSRAIVSLPDDVTEIDWIDANNNTIKLTKPKFSEALVLAGQEQTNIFTTYNELREQVNNATTIEELEGLVWA